MGGGITHASVAAKEVEGLGPGRGIIHASVATEEAQVEGIIHASVATEVEGCIT